MLVVWDIIHTHTYESGKVKHDASSVFVIAQVGTTPDRGV